MDVLSFLQSRGIKFYNAGDGIREKHIDPTGTWSQCVCPICGGNKLWLGYHKTAHYFNCYNHGFSSFYSLFRAWFPNENTKELLSQIDSDVTIPTPLKEQTTGVYNPPMPQKPLMDSYYHREYVKSRGLNPEELSEKWKITALCDVPEFRYRGRLFFPVYSREGELVSWLTRTVSPDQPIRYLTAPKDRELYPIKNYLYGEQFLSSFDTVIVVEGVFDALRIGRNVVATLGKKLTKAQINKISKYPRRIICLDGKFGHKWEENVELETQEQARDLAYELSVYPGITDRVELDASDPASAPQKEIDALLRYAELI